MGGIVAADAVNTAHLEQFVAADKIGTTTGATGNITEPAAVCASAGLICAAAKPLPEAMAPTITVRRVTSIAIPPPFNGLMGGRVSQTGGVSSLAHDRFQPASAINPAASIPAMQQISSLSDTSPEMPMAPMISLSAVRISTPPITGIILPSLAEAKAV